MDVWDCVLLPPSLPACLPGANTFEAWTPQPGSRLSTRPLLHHQKHILPKPPPTHRACPCGEEPLRLMDPHTPRYHPGVTFSYPFMGFSADHPFPKDKLTVLAISNLRAVCSRPWWLPPLPPQRATSGQERKKPGGSPALSCNYLLSHQTETGGNHGDRRLPVLTPLLSGASGLRELVGMSWEPHFALCFCPANSERTASQEMEGAGPCTPLASSQG